jgi:hypothetical protein
MSKCIFKWRMEGITAVEAETRNQAERLFEEVHDPNIALRADECHKTKFRLLLHACPENPKPVKL